MLCHEDSITIFKTLPDPSSFHDFITGFVTRLTRRVPPVEQELLTIPEHLSSPPVFSGVRATRSLFLCFVDHGFSFCPFYFCHCIVCPSIRGFWWPLWYLQTLPNTTLLIQLCMWGSASYSHMENTWINGHHFTERGGFDP